MPAQPKYDGVYLRDPMNLPVPDTRPAGTAPAVLDNGALQRLQELDPDGTAGIFERVLVTYAQTLEAQLPLAHAALRLQDATELRRIAHLLKSSSASLGALAFSALCAELEHHARLGWSPDLPARAQPWLLEAERVAAAVRALQPG